MSQYRLTELIKADIKQYIKFSADFSEENYGKLRMLSSFFTPSVLCCFLYRIAHWFYEHKISVIAKILTRLNLIFHKADITPASQIGPGLYIPHPPGIAFYGHAGRNLTLYARAVVTSANITVERTSIVKQPPKIGDNVIVGAYAVVEGDLTIGNNCTIGPNCCLRSSVADETTLYHVDAVNVTTMEEKS